MVTDPSWPCRKICAPQSRRGWTLRGSQTWSRGRRRALPGGSLRGGLGTLRGSQTWSRGRRRPLPDGSLPQQDFDVPRANQIGEAPHARESHFSVKAQCGAIVPVARHEQPAPPREDLCRDTLDQGPAEPPATRLGPHGQQRDESAEQKAVIDHHDRARHRARAGARDPDASRARLPRQVAAKPRRPIPEPKPGLDRRDPQSLGARQCWGRTRKSNAGAHATARPTSAWSMGSVMRSVRTPARSSAPRSARSESPACGATAGWKAAPRGSSSRAR